MAKRNKPLPDKEGQTNLSGFSTRINNFGEIVHNIDIDKINAFLDEHLDDKKLTARESEEEE